MLDNMAPGMADAVMQAAGMAAASLLPPHAEFLLMAFDEIPGGQTRFVSNASAQRVMHELKKIFDSIEKELSNGKRIIIRGKP